jgi:hypothetical protein
MMPQEDVVEEKPSEEDIKAISEQEKDEALLNELS